MAKKSKKERRKKRLQKKKPYMHCEGWGLIKGVCEGTTQCHCCFTVLKGPSNCIGCKPEWDSKEQRLARNCWHYRPEESKLLSLLESAEEHHCLTVVRMSIKDLKEGKNVDDVIKYRLQVDYDKMRCSQTEAGKQLEAYLNRY